MLKRLKAPVVRTSAGALVSGLVVAGLLVVMAGVVAAQDSTVLNGCYDKKTGALRYLQSGSSCRTNETAISWNQVGPTGPAGPKGETGATGATGPAGPAGSGVMSAQVERDGTLVGGTGVVSASPTPDVVGLFGSYVVTFDTDVTECVPVASIGTPQSDDLSSVPLGQVGTAFRSTNPNAIRVLTADSAGEPTRMPFNLQVTC